MPMKNGFKEEADLEDVYFKPLDPITKTVISTQNTGVVTNNVEFCPFEWGSKLLAYESGINGKLSILSVEIEGQNIAYQYLAEFVTGGRISCIAWSPETSMATIPILFKLAIAFQNQKQIKLLSVTSKTDGTVDATDNDLAVILCQGGNHLDFVNDVAFEPQTGDVLASVADDGFCCLWSSADGGLISRIQLTSAGTSVRWHASDPSKLMVAEKKGVIRLYNAETKRPVMSFECAGETRSYPLLSCDWCITNNLIVGAAQGSEAVFWDVSASSIPKKRRKGTIKIAQKLRFFNDSVYAVRGSCKNVVEVVNGKTDQVLLCESFKGGSSLSWNCKWPLLAVGANNGIAIYRFNALL